MKILFIVSLGEFACDVHVNSQLYSLLDKLSKEKNLEFKFLSDSDTINNFTIEASVPFVKNTFLPNFQVLINDLKDKQIQDYIFRQVKVSFKLDTAKTNLRQGTLDDFIDYIDGIIQII